MIMKQCARCKGLIVYPNTYCDKCKPIVEKEKEEAKARAIAKGRGKGGSDARAYRDPKYRKFYLSKEWKLLRKKYMQDHKYKCECCGVIASEVHHKKPIQTEEGWDLRLDYTNLKAVCVRCHNEEHKRFNARKKRFKKR